MRFPEKSDEATDSCTTTTEQLNNQKKRHQARKNVEIFINNSRVVGPGAGKAGEAIATPDLKALQEVSQREKELILVLSAEENDLKSLKVFESMGTNIEARAGIQIY